MKDIFENKILCEHCDKKMEKANVSKDGFLIRLMVCKDCGDKIVHPIDEHNYNKFISLKNKEFSVKMRLVGNSYAVSIPKEIVSFMNAQRTMMNNMVKLCFEEAGRVSLSFSGIENHPRRRRE